MSQPPTAMNGPAGTAPNYSGGSYSQVPSSMGTAAAPFQPPGGPPGLPVPTSSGFPGAQVMSGFAQAKAPTIPGLPVRRLASSTEAPFLGPASTKLSRTASSSTA